MAEGDERPIGELVGQLIDDGKAYARAEANLAKVRAKAEADHLKRPMIFGGLAAALALVALVALVMTLVLAMASLLGPLAGGLLVVAILAGLAALFASLAAKTWKARK